MQTSPVPEEPEWVTEDRIREIFNGCQVLERHHEGHLVQRILAPDHHLKRTGRERSGEPKCTRSQMVLYSRPDGTPVALAHRYKRKDGSLGGSGRPDPKKLFLADGRVIATRGDS